MDFIIQIYIDLEIVLYRIILFVSNLELRPKIRTKFIIES
jgi:hypothetical protein